MKQTMDMTQGKPLGVLIRFSVPMLLANICQELYAVADSAIVGRFLGVDAFAAVARRAAGTVSWLAVDIILGFTQGFGIFTPSGSAPRISRAFAAVLPCPCGWGWDWDLSLLRAGYWELNVCSVPYRHPPNCSPTL